MDWSGRRLEKGEEVHHKDHSRGNNCLRNLEVVRADEHRRIKQSLPSTGGSGPQK